MLRKNLTVMGSALLLLVSVSAAHAEPMTKEQGDVILKELREIKQLLQRPAQQAPKPDEPGSTSVAGLPFLGKADAPLTMVMFTDYQCPFCSRFEAQTLTEIKKQYIDTGKLRFVVRDLPLPMHPNAPKAAEAAHCGAEQGKYWELRELLVANGRNLEPKQLPEYAKQVGLDMEKFNACLESGRQAEKVKAGAAAAEALGFSGTPSFVIGRSKGDMVEGVKLVGAHPFPAFEQRLKELEKGPVK